MMGGGQRSAEQKGVTLIEMMIVVVIVAALVAIAWPSYREHVRSARRADAQSVLLQAAQYMERFYSENTSYSQETGGGSVSLPSHLTQAPTESTPTFYNVALESVSSSSYVLRATPVNDQVGMATWSTPTPGSNAGIGMGRGWW